MKNVKFLLLTSYSALGGLLLTSSLVFGEAGVETFDFLRIPSGARHSGIGKCNIGLIGDPFAIFANPAAIRGVKWGSGYMHYIAGIYTGCVTKISPLANGTFGIGLNYWNFGRFKAYDASGNATGNFYSKSIVPALAYARTINDFSFGANLKFIYQTIAEYTSTGIASDLGILIPVKTMEGLIIGGTVQNLGTQITKFDGTEEKLPVFARIGGVYALSDNRQLSAEISLPEKEYLFGLEVQASPMFTIRGGYFSSGGEIETGRALEFLGGLTLGLGFKASNFLIDYAFIPMAELGLVHQISLIYLPVSRKEEQDIME